MALRHDALGATTTHTSEITPDRAILYALGVGAKADELDLLYEGRGPKVLPTYAVIPAYDAMIGAMGSAGVSFDNVVHGHQKITLHRDIPARAALTTTATVSGIYDMKRMAQVVVTTRTADASGEALFDTEWGILVLGEGGWGGDPPPARENPRPDRPADFEVEQATTPEQALLYRLMGDGNPLHADPEFPLVKQRFGGRPILHGLCTYGFLGRALAKQVGGASRVKHLSARFTKPVWPGDTLATEGWIDGDRAWLRTTSRASGEVVLSHGYAELKG